MIQSINKTMQSTVHTPTLNNLFATIPREYVRVRYYTVTTRHLWKSSYQDGYMMKGCAQG